MVRTKAQRSEAARKANVTRKEMKRKKTLSRIAKKAFSKNFFSEKNFVERLRRKGFFSFTTGKAEGPPDIVAYKNGKLSFYEIKPSHPKTSKDALFKRTQSEWIKKYCFKSKVKVNLVFYKGSRSFKYHIVPITKKNISDFEYKQKNLDDIIERTKKFSYK